MEIKAKAKNIRISPKKVRLVADLVRGMKIGTALDQLKFLNKKASLPVSKLIDSGVANALNNYDLDKNNLYIKEIKVDEGRTLHRHRPRAYGRATPIRKRFSHIVLILGELKDSGKVEAKKQEIEAPVSLSELTKQGEKKTQKKESKKEDKKKEKSSSVDKDKQKKEKEEKNKK